MKRRRAREYALQMLFQLDLTKSMKVIPASLYKDFWNGIKEEDDVRKFANTIVEGTVEHIEKIDSVIKQVAEHWGIDRMAVVDRNILRTAIYELLYQDIIPSSVTINEAIEIAKKYGTEESYAFINGILDKIKRTVVSSKQ